MKDIVVVGAGIGGLVTAAALSRLGYPVTVLEAHVYAGGCAGTFYHQGFRFDAGATLTAGFYPGGPMDLVAQASGIETWQGRTTDLAMLVHMPDGEKSLAGEIVAVSMPTRMLSQNKRNRSGTGRRIPPMHYGTWLYDCPPGHPSLPRTLLN